MANIHWIIEKAREFQKIIYFCFIDYKKAFDCVNHNQLWKILKQMGIPDHLTYLLRNLYAGQEATIRTRHGITDWFKIGNGVHQGCILSSCFLNLYADYITQEVNQGKGSCCFFPFPQVLFSHYACYLMSKNDCFNLTFYFLTIKIRKLTLQNKFEFNYSLKINNIQFILTLPHIL